GQRPQRPVQRPGVLDRPRRRTRTALHGLGRPLIRLGPAPCRRPSDHPRKPAMDTTFDHPASIRRAMQAAQRRRQCRALPLVGPLALFLLAVFVIPIAVLLTRAADNPEVIETLPRTLQALSGWDGSSEPPDAAFRALAQDLEHAKNTPAAGELARRLNYEIS